MFISAFIGICHNACSTYRLTGRVIYCISLFETESSISVINQHRENLVSLAVFTIVGVSLQGF